MHHSSFWLLGHLQLKRTCPPALTFYGHCVNCSESTFIAKNKPWEMRRNCLKFWQITWWYAVCQECKTKLLASAKLSFGALPVKQHESILHMEVSWTSISTWMCHEEQEDNATEPPFLTFLFLFGVWASFLVLKRRALRLVLSTFSYRLVLNRNTCIHILHYLLEDFSKYFSLTFAYIIVTLYDESFREKVWIEYGDSYGLWNLSFCAHQQLSATQISKWLW